LVVNKNWKLFKKLKNFYGFLNHLPPFIIFLSLLSSDNISSRRPEMVGGEAPAVGPARGPGAGARGVGVARGIGGVETGGFGGDFGSGTEGAVGLTGGDEIGGVVFGGVGTAGAGGFGAAGDVGTDVGGFGAAGDVGTDVGGFGTVGAGVAGAGGVTGLFGIAGLGAAGGGATEGVLCAEFTAGVGVFLINGDFAAVCGGLIG